MGSFVRAVGLVLAAVLGSLVLQKRERELALVLTLGVCAMVLLGTLKLLEPAVDFLMELGEMGNLKQEWMAILLKIAGIGLLGELAALICTDAGEAALGKALTMTASAAILWQSLPLFRGLLELIQGILEGI